MKIKLGNDINFTWNVYRDGEPEDWTGKVIEVKLLSPHKTECVITNIDHSTQGVITFTYLGMNQTIYGDYTAVLYENNGDEGMVAVDAVKAVTLVRHSYQTSVAQDSTIITDSVILEGSITAIPSTPFTQIQANWEETDTASPAYILHKPDLTVFVTNTALATTLTDYVTNNVLSITLADYVTNTALSTALAGKADKSEMSVVPGTGADADKTTITLKQGTSATVLTTHQDITGKEDVTNIVTPVDATDAALPITTLTCEVGKYYRIDVAVDTLAITLPAMADLTTARTVVIYLTAVTTHAVAISAADNKDVYYQDGFEIEAGNTYEINALFNGAAWIVAAVKINTSNS